MHHLKSRFRRSRTPTPEASTPKNLTPTISRPETPTKPKNSSTDHGEASKQVLPEAAAVSKAQPANSSEPSDLWDRAYKRLHEDTSSAKILEEYEKILIRELSGTVDSHYPNSRIDKDTSDSNPGLAREKQMAALVSKKLESIETARWKLQLGHATFEVKAQVDRIAKAVLFAKDFISSAASSEPHAALAWAGVSVLLPVSACS